MKPLVLLSHLYALASPALASTEYTVPSSVPPNDVLDGYVSYSIEFSSFPDFAGNTSHPNTYSDTLLDNIARVTGTKPYIRVGGNTQDYALFDASLPLALNGSVDPARSPDYPTTITIGPSYFESYGTWKDVRFCHGFNLGLGANRSTGWQTLLDTVPLACKALGGGKLYAWTYGNEPDLYSTSAQGPVRPAGWDETTFVAQWKNGTGAIKRLLEEHCPELATDEHYGYLAPSFAGVGNRLRAPAAWAAGLDREKSIKLFATHNYISGASSPGVTLQGTLMNHAVTKRSVDAHVAEYDTILSQSPGPVPPLIFGETNSLYNQGRPGLSNTFGAALWGLDFNLYAASVGFKRVHMHVGTNYRYAPWQPLSTPLSPIGTKAPYYGSIAVAAALGRGRVTVVEIPLTTTGSINNNTTGLVSPEAAYAVYTRSGARLARVVVINMRGYNTTVGGAGLAPLPDPGKRGEVEYVFRLSSSSSSSTPSTPLGGTEQTAAGGQTSTDGEGKEQRRREVRIQRLLANGSDAITGVTFDGWSYNWELAGGRPVRLGNVTVGERAVVGEDGVVRVTVPDASAVVLDLGGGDDDDDDGGERGGE